jgi:hypothetical protein
MDFDIQYFAGLTLGHDFEWAATHLTVGRKPLFGDTGIDLNLERFPAKRALDTYRNFHRAYLYHKNPATRSWDKGIRKFDRFARLN